MTSMQWFYLLTTGISCGMIMVGLESMFDLPTPVSIGSGILIGVIALKMAGL